MILKKQARKNWEKETNRYVVIEHLNENHL
jgi:hypothetical protein